MIKISFLSIFICFFQFSTMAQFKAMDKRMVKAYPFFKDDGVILGSDYFDVTITGLDYNKDHDIYRISGFIDIAYYSPDSYNDTFYLCVIDSSSLYDLTPINEYVPDSAIKIISKYTITKYGLFTIFLKTSQYAEVFSSIPTKIVITPGELQEPINKKFDYKKRSKR